MYTEQEETQVAKELLAQKRRAIVVSLVSFAENYRKETTPELSQIWTESLSHLSLNQIAQGTKLCLQELEFFPTVANFLERATQRSKESDRWQEFQPNPEQEQIEHIHKPVPMPDKYKRLWRSYMAKTTVK